MSASASENTNRLLSTVSYAALFSAGVAGIFTGHAVREGLAAGGFGMQGDIMAAAAAVAMTACYGSFLHIAIKGCQSALNFDPGSAWKIDPCGACTVRF